MASRTQQPMGRPEVVAVLRNMLGSGTHPAQIERLRGGTFNTCLGIELSDGHRVVLKIAPPADQDRLSHERDLLQNEVRFFSQARTLGVPVPEVLATDFSRRIIRRDCFLMTRLPGRPLSLMRFVLPRRKLGEVRRDLGRCAAKLGQLTGSAFGYAPLAAGAEGATWQTTFGLMMERLLQDAVRFQVHLPLGTAALRALVTANTDALSTVSSPRLVHFDLWDGNVLVDGSAVVPRVSGIIDAERSFFGDPYAEFASLALFRDITKETELLRGWRDVTGQAIVWDGLARRRVALAQLYLYLINLVEMAPRAVHRVRRFLFGRWVTRALRRVIAQLEVA